MQNERRMVQKRTTGHQDRRTRARDEQENRKMPNEVMTHELISATMSSLS